ncbi:MAG: hypothetical protein AAFY88_22010, partial [Acidobacteriota bacterium]
MPTALQHPSLGELSAKERLEVVFRASETLAADTRRGLFAFPAAYALVVGAAGPPSRLGVFFYAAAAVTLLSTLWRGWLAFRFDRAFEDAPDRWRRSFDASLLISSAAWGL